MQINRAKFITTLAGGLCAFPLLVRAESAEEQPIYDILATAVDAQFTYDFSRLVRLLHPASTKLFRDVLSARFDQLVKAYPVNAVLTIAGLSAHPKDVGLTDDEFFVATCNHAVTIRPDFIGDPKLLPLKVHGYIFEGDSTAYLVFSYSGAIHTARTDFDYVQPMNLTFRRVGEEWRIYSAILSQRVAEVWRKQLSRPVIAAETIRPG